MMIFRSGFMIRCLNSFCYTLSLILALVSVPSMVILEFVSVTQALATSKLHYCTTLDFSWESGPSGGL